MLPFFRKIRWRLAADNQFFKYSRYAIGEIVLVVIGILIALYINNWNENRKIEAKILDLFKEVQVDLITNLEQIEMAITFQSTKDSILGSILSDTLSVKDYNNHPELLYQIGNYSHPTIQNEGFKKLERYDDLIPKKYQNVYDSLKLVNSFLKNELSRINSFTNLIARNNDYFVKNWKDFHLYMKVSGDSLIPEEIIDYFRSDPFYKNMVEQYRFVMDDHDWIANRHLSASLYSRLYELTKVDNMPRKYWDLIELNKKQYEGVYKLLDSSGIVKDETRRITVAYGYGFYQHLVLDGDTSFIAIKKDSFANYYNNTLYFKRDSLNRIIGAVRYFNGKYSELDKVD